MEQTILGLDIGGTKTSVLLGRCDIRASKPPVILAKETFPTYAPGDGFAECFERICSKAEATHRQADEMGTPVDGISVSIGGPLDIERGIILSPPNLPGWDRIPLKQLLAERFGVPVYVEHDGNTGALAEWLFGAGRGYRSLVFLTMGTGFGAGLILDGRLYRGITSTAGEIGHIRLAEDGPYGFGKHGSAEGFCSGTGMARLAQIMFPDRWSPTLSARDLTELAQENDPAAVAVVQQVGKYLGRALALLVDLLNPEMIIIGSMAMRLGELVLQPAREELAREALPQAVAVLKITTPELGERMQDIAALSGAIYEMRTASVPDTI